MNLRDLLRDLPPPYAPSPARRELRDGLRASGARIAVVDDDPTGTQTVHGVWVTTDWTPDVLRSVASSPERVFYVSTNSRALDGPSCQRISHEVGTALRSVAAETGRIVLASRSDSTLRGHFPGELLSLCRGLEVVPRAVLLVPAFFEGGRYTVGDVHWVEQGGELVRASSTEFARDSTFGYRASDLPSWVEEKTSGAVRAGDVASLSLELIRSGGPDAVAGVLRDACARSPGFPASWPLGRIVVVNAACYEDLDVVAAGVATVESEGTPLAYRCAASFVKSRGGFDDRPLLRGPSLIERPGAGLLVMGSYVERSTRQLEALLEAGNVQAVELDVDRLVDPARRDAEVAGAATRLDAALRAGKTAVAYTSRSTHLASRPGHLALGVSIMGALCDMVRALRARPAWVLAKGGITSIEIARALGMRRARVLGQVAKGVPVWRLAEGSVLAGAPYVVFPGNVGDEGTLLEVVTALETAEGSVGR